MTDPLPDLVAFGHRLREEGMAIDVGRLASFAGAIALTSPLDAYWAGRATLVGRAEDIALYDRVFAEHFNVSVQGRAELGPPAQLPGEAGLVDLPDAEDQDAVLSSAAPASAVERLKHKRFEECSPAELAALAALVRRVTLSMAPRVTRRYDPGPRGRLDTRRMVRGSWRTGGELSTIARRERRWRRRRMVVVLDVSGSMAAYSRALLVFAHASVTVDARWEAFCFATRLTRLTGALRTQDPDAALRAASDEVVDWDGGTRIGESLKALIDEHGHGRLLRGSVVIICSDGLDVGRPELLGEQMGRLARLARTVVWVNPLRASPGYAPLAGGMAAALPHVDVFADGHNLDSLETVARRLGERGRAHRPRR